MLLFAFVISAHKELLFFRHEFLRSLVLLPFTGSLTTFAVRLKNISTVKEILTTNSQKIFLAHVKTSSEEIIACIWTVLLFSARICKNILSADHPRQPKDRSPLHSEPVFHLLHSVVLGAQQLLGSLLSHTAEPRLVQLSHAVVLFWQQGALCLVERLHFLEKLLWVLTR